MDDKIYELKANEGICVSSKEKHRILNNSKNDLHFIVISEPKSHGDRYIIDE